MNIMNGSLRYAANGEADVFLGEKESKEAILERVLKLGREEVQARIGDIKKSIGRVIDFFRGLKDGKGRFIKRTVPVFTDSGAIEYADCWVPESIEKTLTWSGHPLQGRAKVQGMDISIENKKGSVRSGTDKDGHEWHSVMRYDYGYIRGTVGVDKDHVDCYIGANPESEIVYIVNQNDPVTGDFDEQKVMLGFKSEADAKAAYLKQYDRPGFFGDIIKMDIDTFKEEAFDVGNKGKPLTRRAA
jgi:hypothetical protein